MLPTTAPRPPFSGASSNGTNPSPQVIKETPLQRIERVRGYLQDKTLIPGEDYGLIPGGQNAKKCLLKPGAQKLCGLFELATVIKNVDRIHEDDFVAYEVTVALVNKVTNAPEAEGIGECNSRERRFKNKPAWDNANTLLKMAKKRGLVDATLDALGISSLFTQDLDDMDAPEPEPRKGAAAKSELAYDPMKERFENIEAMPNDHFRECVQWIKDNCPNHPQKAEFEAEYRRRAEASKKAKAASEPESKTEAHTNLERFVALVQSAGQLPGFQAFLVACDKRGLGFSNDDQLAAFEKAASELTEFPLAAEDMTESDWVEWATVVGNGDMDWPA